jgi:hypothetical protein
MCLFFGANPEFQTCIETARTLEDRRKAYPFEDRRKAHPLEDRRKARHTLDNWGRPLYLRTQEGPSSWGQKEVHLKTEGRPIHLRKKGRPFHLRTEGWPVLLEKKGRPFILENRKKVQW